MISLTLAEVAQIVGGRLTPTADPDARILGVVQTDSRQVGPGDLYVARRGEHGDGLDYVDSAIAAGAVTAIAEREEASVGIVVADPTLALGQLAAFCLARLRESADIRVIAITGSVGKTTTKDLLNAICSRVGPTVAPLNSFNNRVGLPLTVLRATPETRYLVLEMGANHRGEIAELTRIAPPDVAVVLCVGTAHLGEFGSIEEIAEAKSEIIQGMADGGVAVLNQDDARVRDMARTAPGAVEWFGRQDADVTFGNVAEQGAHLTFDLTLPDGRPHRIVSGLRGSQLVVNAAAAACAALSAGIEPGEVIAGLSGAGLLSPHRMQVTDTKKGVRVIDDAYNANPQSVAAALDELVRLAQGREGQTWAVLGPMGELGAAGPELHREIGRLAGRLGIDRILVVGDEAAGIAQGASDSQAPRHHALLCSNLTEARDSLVAAVRPGDTILVKASNSMRLWQIADMLVDEED